MKHEMRNALCLLGCYNQIVSSVHNCPAIKHWRNKRVYQILVTLHLLHTFTVCSFVWPADAWSMAGTEIEYAAGPPAFTQAITAQIKSRIWKGRATIIYAMWTKYVD